MGKSVFSGEIVHEYFCDCEKNSRKLQGKRDFYQHFSEKLFSNGYFLNELKFDFSKLIELDKNFKRKYSPRQVLINKRI